MKRMLIGLFVIVAATPVCGFNHVATVDWQVLQDAQALPAGARIEVGESGGPAELVVDHSGPGPLELTLAVIEAPEILGIRWAISGELRPEGVEGEGYLEMLSCFAPEQCHFSRTMAESGPLAAISGSSDWREVVLPFVSTAELGPPRSVQVRLVLAGAGRVQISPLRLVELEEGENPMRLGAPRGWWSGQTGGWIGAIAGLLIGLGGAVIGILASRGSHRRLALAGMWVSVAVGVLLLGVGAAAFSAGQAYAVWYPVVLIGFLLVVIGGCLLPVVARRFAEHEERTLRSMDR